MMQVMPMPCCGKEPPIELVAPDFGWDPETGLCRNCGEPSSDYHCDSPTCRHGTPKGVRFCEGCEGAVRLTLEEAGALILPGNGISDILEELEQRIATPRAIGHEIPGTPRHALRNVLMLARRMKRRVEEEVTRKEGIAKKHGLHKQPSIPQFFREAPDHLIRFCREAGVYPSILRGEDDG